MIELIPTNIQFSNNECCNKIKSAYLDYINIYYLPKANQIELLNKQIKEKQEQIEKDKLDFFKEYDKDISEYQKIVRQPILIKIQEEKEEEKEEEIKEEVVEEDNEIEKARKKADKARKKAEKARNKEEYRRFLEKQKKEKEEDLRLIDEHRKEEIRLKEENAIRILIEKAEREAEEEEIKKRQQQEREATQRELDKQKKAKEKAERIRQYDKNEDIERIKEEERLQQKIIEIRVENIEKRRKEKEIEAELEAADFAVEFVENDRIYKIMNKATLEQLKIAVIKEVYKKEKKKGTKEKKANEIANKQAIIAVAQVAALAESFKYLKRIKHAFPPLDEIEKTVYDISYAVAIEIGVLDNEAKKIAIDLQAQANEQVLQMIDNKAKKLKVSSSIQLAKEQTEKAERINDETRIIVNEILELSIERNEIIEQITQLLIRIFAYIQNVFDAIKLIENIDKTYFNQDKINLINLYLIRVSNYYFTLQLNYYIMKMYKVHLEIQKDELNIQQINELEQEAEEIVNLVQKIVQDTEQKVQEIQEIQEIQKELANKEILTIAQETVRTAKTQLGVIKEGLMYIKQIKITEDEEDDLDEVDKKYLKFKQKYLKYKQKYYYLKNKLYNT